MFKLKSSSLENWLTRSLYLMLSGCTPLGLVSDLPEKAMQVEHSRADSDNRLPLYARLRDQLASRIANGEWAPGDMIPSENRLADHYSVAVATMRMALKQLVDEGVLERRRGRGTFVRQPAFRADLFRFFHVHDAEDGSSLIPESRILTCETVKTPGEVAQAFGDMPGDMCLRLKRLRLWSGEPMLAEEIHLRLPDFEGLETLKDTDFGPLLYPLFLQRFGILIASATDELSIGKAGDSQASLLGVNPGDAVAMIERTARNPVGRVVEYRRVWGRADRFRYRVTTGDAAPN